MIRFSQDGREASVHTVNVYFLAGYIEAFLRQAATHDSSVPLNKNHREESRFRLTLERTGPREITFIARAHPHTLGLLIDYIWTYDGATVNAVHLNQLTGTIPLPGTRA